MRCAWFRPCRDDLPSRRTLKLHAVTPAFQLLDFGAGTRLPYELLGAGTGVGGRVESHVLGEGSFFGHLRAECLAGAGGVHNNLGGVDVEFDELGRT